MASDLLDELRRSKARFEEENVDFYGRRKVWDSLLKRQLKTELPPELEGSQEGLQYQTPELLKALFDQGEVLVMNPVIFGVNALDQADSAKVTGREIMLWTARGWEYENDGRWWDKAVGHGQIRHGIKTMAQRWNHASIEPEQTALEANGVEEAMAVISKAASGLVNALKDNRDAKKDQKWVKHPFYWLPCDYKGMSWMGNPNREEGADVAYYQYQIAYSQAKSEFSSATRQFTLSRLGKVAWVDRSQSIESEYTGDAVIWVTVRDARKLDGSRCKVAGCDHPQRDISVYASLTGEELNEEDLVDTIDSPFPGNSFHIIGGRTTDDDDLNLSYTPLMMPMYVEAVWQNYLTTTMATIARQDYSDDYFYIDLSNVPAHVRIPEGGVLMSVERPEPGSGELPLYPGPVQKYPRSMSPHFLELLNQSHQRMVEFKMNRFLSGQAYTEASNATALAFKSQYQQAALPFNGLLANSAMVIRRSRRYEIHAIKFWGLSEPKESKTRYYAIMTGSESVKGRKAKSGETIWVDADKLNLDFDISVTSASETLAEQEQRWVLGKDMYSSGVYDEEDLITSAGIEDVEGQLEKLRASYVVEDMSPLLREATKEMLTKRASILTGFDLGALVGRPVFPSEPGQLDASANEPANAADPNGGKPQPSSIPDNAANPVNQGASGQKNVGQV